MNRLLKHLCSTQAWKTAAEELGGQYIPGRLRYLGAGGSIEIPNGDHAITIAAQIGEDANPGVSSAGGYYTRVTAPVRIAAADRFALSHGAIDQLGFALSRGLAVMLDKTQLHDSAFQALEKDVPALGKDWILVGKNREAAMAVLGNQDLVDLLRDAPFDLKIVVGGRSTHCLEGFGYSHIKHSSPSDVFLVTKGIVTETQRLVWMIDVVRAILDTLDKTDRIEP